MLQLIDQRWREHLTEMDYLREGINLRAMGQRDPLTEWQREGFDLFAAMMNALTVDYVRYLMHVEVAIQTVPAPAAEVTDTVASGPAEGGGVETEEGLDTGTNGSSPASGPNGSDDATTSSVRPGPRPIGPPARRRPPTWAGRGWVRASPPPTSPPSRRAPATRLGRRPPRGPSVVNDEWDKTPRNAPCPCGSGKKFKQCHGR